MKQEFAMETTLPILSKQDRQEQRNGPRRSVREGMALRVIVADKAGLASGQLIDMTAKGCGLRLTKPLMPGQYLTLMVYPDDGTASVQCDVAQVQWGDKDRAGVAFLWMSLEHDRRMQQLFGDRFVFEFEE